MNVTQDLLNRVRRTLPEHAQTDAALARRLRMSPQRIHNYLHGKRQLDVSAVLRVCRILGIDCTAVLVKIERERAAPVADDETEAAAA